MNELQKAIDLACAWTEPNAWACVFRQRDRWLVTRKRANEWRAAGRDSGLGAYFGFAEGDDRCGETLNRCWLETLGQLRELANLVRLHAPEFLASLPIVEHSTRNPTDADFLAWSRQMLELEGRLRLKPSATSRPSGGRVPAGPTEQQINAVRAVLQEANRPNMGREAIQSGLKRRSGAGMRNQTLSAVLDALRDLGEYTVPAKPRRS